MEKKIILKRKIKTISIILFIIIVFFVYLIIKQLLNIKIQNIYVLNNNYLPDDYILEKSGLMDYPSYFKNISFMVENKLEKDDFIKKANVTKSFFGVINIYLKVVI